MNDENKVNAAINEINKLVDDDVLKNLSNDQLSKLSELINEIQRKLSE
ncbi:MAG: hypothetical protein J6B87_05155 [Clostridia bacterium]|nr:hypothetical protein [Clostridia bacterium]